MELSVLESFGCCSFYMKCSDNGRCLFPDDETYEGCMYNKNLLAGKNFYSKKIISAAVKKHDKIFIDCYERNFKVGRLGKTGFTYPLDNSEIELIAETFEKHKIPYSHVSEDSKCVMEGEEQEPANSRVVFKVPGNEQEFVIANYNACLILKKYATGVIKAMLAKGIDAKLNLVGQYANVITKVIPKVITPDVENIVETKNVNTENNFVIGIDLANSKDYCVKTVFENTVEGIKIKESIIQDDRNYNFGTQKPNSNSNINVTQQTFKQLSIFDLGLV